MQPTRSRELAGSWASARRADQAGKAAVPASTAECFKKARRSTWSWPIILPPLLSFSQAMPGATSATADHSLPERISRCLNRQRPVSWRDWDAPRLPQRCVTDIYILADTAAGRTSVSAQHMCFFTPGLRASKMVARDANATSVALPADASNGCAGADRRHHRPPVWESISAELAHVLHSIPCYNRCAS